MLKMFNYIIAASERDGPEAFQVLAQNNAEGIPEVVCLLD
jgi:hypothetical protein